MATFVLIVVFVVLAVWRPERAPLCDGCHQPTSVCTCKQVAL